MGTRGNGAGDLGTRGMGTGGNGTWEQDGTSGGTGQHDFKMHTNNLPVRTGIWFAVSFLEMSTISHHPKTMQIYQVHKRERRHRQIRQVHKRENIYLLCFLQIPHWLVVPTPLKNMKVSWGYYSQQSQQSLVIIPNNPHWLVVPNIWKNKKCSKPPTSSGFIAFNMKRCSRCNSSKSCREFSPTWGVNGLGRRKTGHLLWIPWTWWRASSQESWPMESELINDHRSSSIVIDLNLSFHHIIIIIDPPH